MNFRTHTPSSVLYLLIKGISIVKMNLCFTTKIINLEAFGKKLL